MSYQSGAVDRARRSVLLTFAAAVLGVLTSQHTFATASISLAWDPSPDPTVTGYNIYYGVASRAYTNVVNVGDVTNAIVSGLVEGSTYYFAATAYNSLGMESDFSPEVSCYIPPAGINHPPTLDPISSFTIVENAGLQTVNLTGITSGATNEIQVLTVTATSSNPSLIPNPTVTYTSPNSTGTISFTPVANAYGSASITVTVNDNAGSNNIISRTFTVTVDSPPTITSIPNQTIATNTSTAALGFTISDKQTAASALTLQAASSAPALIPLAGIVFSGSGANRTVKVTPAPGKSGVVTVTVTVSDGIATSSTTFQVTVLASPAPPSMLTVITNGLGSVTPNLSLQSLAVGKTYTLTATPGSGQVFTGWSGSLSSSSPKITFLMTSNLTLQANFHPSPFIPVAGSYNGLFYESDAVRLASSGILSVKVTPAGTYSGKLQLGGQRYSISGKLNLQCQATNLIVRPKSTTLAVELQIGTGAEAGQMTGDVNDGTWTAALSGDRATFDAKLNPAPLAGTYTLLVPGQDGDVTEPAGDGFGSVRISSSGLLRFAGMLADGTKVSQGSVVAMNGRWPVFVSLYSGNGSTLGWITFSNQPDSDLAGALNWTKSPMALARYYAAGFAFQSSAAGSAYVPPVGTNTIFSVTNVDASVVLSQGNVAVPTTNSITLGQGGKVTSTAPEAITMAFSLPTGTFKGKVYDPAVGKMMPFSGAVLQKSNTGSGFLLGVNLSSRVTLTP